MTRQHEVVDLKDVTIVRETEAAIQIATDSGELVWLPLSQVEAIHRQGMNQDWLVVTRWIADKKGLL
jgi:hypothetical protein